MSRVGRVRVDVVYDPTGPLALQVITERVVTGVHTIVPVPGTRLYPEHRKLLDRLQLHFSIGQPW
jgi:hypothetical protein